MKIKEKLEIKPEVNNYLNLKKTSTVTHNVKLVLDWVQTYIGDNHDIPMNRYKFKINKYLMDKCSDIFYSDYDYSGHLEYEFTADKAVTYDFTILLSTRTEWDPNYDEDEPSGVTFQVYVDGILFKEISQSGFINPWFGYYDINLPEENIDFNQQIYTYDYRSNKCATIIGSFDNDYANISIVNGNEYLSFYDYTSLDYLGDSFYAKDYINTEYPLIIYDNPCYEDNILGIIKGEVNGAIAFDTVRINKMSEESIKVSFEPEKIFQGDTANITLQKMYEDGSLEAFPTEQKFDVNLISGTNKYGVLLSSNGIDTSNSFTQITQGFKFIAKKNILEDTVEVFLNVSTVIGNAEENVGEVNNNLSAALGKRINNNDKQDVNKKDRVITPIDPGGGGPHEIQGTGKVIVISDSPDHFEISIIPDTLAAKDTLAFTETAKLVIQAKDENGADVELDDTKTLKFEVTSYWSYGTFIKPNGDTLKTFPVVIKNITYADAKAGKVKFAAVKANPDSVVNCNIRVKLQEDTTKTGEREAVVLEQTLKIVMSGDKEVEPIITGLSYDPESDTYLNHIKERNRKQFLVRITRGGKLLRRHKIRLETEYIDNSGGHNHITPRRPDSAFSYQRKINGVLTTKNIPTERIRRQNYGSFYSYNSGNNFSVDSLHGKIYTNTLNDTIFVFDYVASLWGDSIKIYLESLDNPMLYKDSIIVNEKIPNLVSMPENENYYELVGSPLNNSNTNDPCRSPESLISMHNYNHYGKTSIINAIENIASEYQILHPNIRLRINDISLRNGGKFDINNSWRGGHASHRLGTNADIGFTGINENGNCVNINKNDLRKIIIRHSSKLPYIEGDHYHIYVSK